MKGFIAVLLALGLAGAAWYYQPHLWLKAPPPQEESIEWAGAEVRSIDQYVRCSGELVADQATEIRSEVSGRVAKLLVKAGEQVTEAQPLLELESKELKSELEEAELRYEASQIRRQKVTTDYERKKALRDQKFVMEKDLADSEIELQLATNALEIDRTKVQTVKEKLAKLTIRAPHPGTVLNVKAREGVVIVGATAATETTLLMQVADLGRMQVLSDINEVDVTKVAIGMSASVTFDSFPGVSLRGKVDSVSLSALPRDKDKSIRAFPIVIGIESADSSVRPGITASAAIATAKNPRALAVPASAVFVEGGRKIVYRKNGAGFEMQPVETGISDYNWVEIRSGLTEGAQVALQRPPESWLGR